MNYENINEYVNGRVLAQSANGESEVINLTKEGKDIYYAIKERVNQDFDIVLYFYEEEEGWGLHFYLKMFDDAGKEIFNERIGVKYDDDIDDAIDCINKCTRAMVCLKEYFD